MIRDESNTTVGSTEDHQNSRGSSFFSCDEGYGQSQSSSSVGRSRDDLLASQLPGDAEQRLVNARQELNYKRVVDLLDYLNIDDNRLCNPETRISCKLSAKYMRHHGTYVDSAKGCRLCRQSFSDSTELLTHVQSFDHRFNINEREYLALSSSSPLITPQLISITIAPIGVTNGSTDGEKLRIIICNKTCPTVSMIGIYLRYAFVIDPVDNTLINLSNGSRLPEYLHSCSKAQFVQPLDRFTLNKQYKIILYYSINKFDFVNEYHLVISKNPVLKMHLNKLNLCFPHPELRLLHKKHYRENPQNPLNDDEKLLLETITAHKNACPKNRLNPTNYKQMFSTMIGMEDEIASRRALAHDQLNQPIIHFKQNIYVIKINNEKLENAAIEYERLWVMPMSMWHKKQHRNRNYSNRSNRFGDGPAKVSNNMVRSKRNRIYGSVDEVKQDSIFVRFDESLAKFRSSTGVDQRMERYFIRFMNNRTTFLLEHQALDMFSVDEPFQFVFPSASEVRQMNYDEEDAPVNEELVWITADVNDEQKRAIKHILHRTAFPLPFILFGPPGTGKTKTLVEAISQITELYPTNHILVCASSNSACNEITQRLMKVVPEKMIFRMFSQSVEIQLVPADVCRISNLANGKHYYPPLKKLYEYKIVICTLTTAGRFVQANIDKTHFTHIFIDECGSATETQSLIAIAGLCTSENKIHASVVMAGDPKQLGPVIKCSFANQMGYGMSMLERLMENHPYQRTEDGNYNSRYIMQLVRNYRSHSAILHVPNELFYDGSLKPCAAKENIDWYIKSQLLPSPDFPMVFHSVYGKTENKGKETSPFNRAEISVVIDYVKKLLGNSERKIQEHDIGIISPYRKQSEEIQTECIANGWKNIQTGAVEIFQGQERPIIIVSTVRSNSKTIGFLNNPKRLNVLLTRAKCLLIIIGNEMTLTKDKNWERVIDYCKANNSLVGETN